MAVRKDEVNLQVTIAADQAGKTLRELKKEARDIRRALERIPVGTKEFDEARTKLKSVTDAIAAAEGRTKQLVQQTTLWQRALAGIASLGVFELIKSGLNSLLDYGRTSLGLIDQQLKADAQIKTAIESTAGVAGKSLEELQAQANELQKVTLFGDDQTEQSQALLLTFTNIRGEIFDKTIPIIQDLSTAFDQDLKSSSIQLGKALNDPANGLKALQRVGITFSEEQKNLIKSLQASGDIAGAQTVILQELERQVGGSARAAAAAGLGPYQVFQNRLSEIQETIGLLLSKGLSLITPALEAVATFVEGVTQSLLTGKEATGEYATAINIVAGIISRVVTFFIAFGKTLVAIPGFIRENYVAITALGVALVTLNAQGIAAAANTLRLAVAQRAAAIGASAQAAAQRVLNLVMTANPIGLVIAALATLTAVFVTAYKNSETFRRVVTGTFSSVQESIKNTIGFFTDLGSGLINLFTGNFEAAIDSFGKAFTRLNPAEIGKSLKQSFNQGYESVPAPKAEIQTDVPAAEAAGAATGKAFVKKVDEEAEALGDTGAKGAKRFAEALKKALELRLSEIETAFLKEELVTDAALFQKEISESDHGKKILELKLKQYEDQIEAFRQFNQLETKEALEAQKKLLEISQQLTQGKVAPLAPLGAPTPGAVTSQTAGLLEKGDVSAADDELLVLKDKFTRIVDAENNHELLLAEMRRNAANARLEALRGATDQDSIIFQTALDDKLKADEDYQAKLLSNQERTAKFKGDLEKKGFEAQKELFSATIEFLSRDEKARKKNGAVIKALQVAQIQIDGIREIQGIWASVSNIPPPFGQAIGIALTAASVLRAVTAISKVNSTKFALGGIAKFGFFGGRPHSQGGTKGYFDDGTRLEVERDEAFAIVNKRDAPLLRALSGINSLHGVPYFADGGMPKFATGGLPTVNTTPTTVASPQAAAQPLLRNMNSFMEAVDEFGRLVRVFPREVKSRVVYTELRDTANEVATVEADASI
jgi:hypothetical protein